MKTLLRLIFFVLSSGVIIIPCHAGSFNFSANLSFKSNFASDDGFYKTPLHPVTNIEDLTFRELSSLPVKGNKPKAEDDFVTTSEETPVSINVLTNDTSGGDDDDENNDSDIDSATVDLDPETNDIQQSVSTGQGLYTVDNSGQLTFSPAKDFFGGTSIKYTVNSKGEETSDKATVSLTVTNVNDPPQIVSLKQGELKATAGKPLTLSLDNFIVADPDGEFPGDFTLDVLEGNNYSVSDNTVTPDEQFSGVLPVKVIIRDLSAASDPFNVDLLVAKANTQPVITGQTPDPLPTPEEQPITIALADLLVTDAENDYPDDFTLNVSSEAGENYSVSGATITPAPEFNGTLTVPVSVNDGESESEIFSFKIFVSAVNDPPVINEYTPLSTNEDASLTIRLDNISRVTDPDNAYPSGFSLRVQPGTNYTVSDNVITPGLNFSGQLTVPVIVSDGTDDSAPFDLLVTVNEVNDPPAITGQVPLSTREGQGIALQLPNFSVSDTDDTYPTGFTLFIQSGVNYSVSENIITPNPGFNGNLTVPVYVSDGSANSGAFNTVITVTATNDAPVITGQRDVSVLEDNGIALLLQDLTVTDPDNNYPDGFSLIVEAGPDYTFTGTTVTPALNFTGALTVNVLVNDGVSNSNSFPLQVTVTPVNDAPDITGQQAVITSEDVGRTIALADLLVSDPDNAYPTGFTLLPPNPGANYTVSGNTIVPVLNYSGSLTIPVQVNDGELNSDIFNLLIQLTPVNDPPMIQGQTPISIDEDTPVTIQLSNLTVMDPDNSYPDGFSLAVGPGSNYTVSGSTVTPVLNFTGTLNVTITVSDGTNSSAPFNFQIQVGNSNDPPVITGQVALSTDEEKPITIELSHLTVTDPDNPYPAGFSLEVSPGVNYSVSGRTITPAVNFAGVLTIPMRVNDGVNYSGTFNFQLQVNQINDPPAFSAIANQQISENSTAKSLTITGITKGPFEESQQLTFVATSSNTNIIDNPTMQYDGVGSTALLSYAVKPNISGVVTITIVAIDNGSNVAPHQNSYSASFQIEVVEINSQPTIDPINNITLLEDAEQQNIALTGITAGPGETQTITVVVSSNKPELFDLLKVVYISPQTTGTLQFKPKANVFGTAQISVTVTDNGSGISPNVNTVIKTFTLVIQPVNDPPVFISTPVTIAVIDELYQYDVQVIDPDNEATIISAISKPDWATLAPISNGRARLTGKPPASALGNVAVQLQAKDASATVTQAFTIYVNVRPTISPLSVITDEDTPKELPSGFFANGYADLNQNPLAGIQITSLPAFGKLLLSNVAVKAGDTIAAASLQTLIYHPAQNYFGPDIFQWKASDGYHLSLTTGQVTITVLSVNDPPVVIIDNDTLRYEVNGEPAFLAALIDIQDPDDDSLTTAQIGFARNYRLEFDVLRFQNTPNIKGEFSFQSGILTLTGKATVAEYAQALRLIQYVHLNTLDPILEPKPVFFNLNDGEDESITQDKLILLQYTFIEFNIPSGFTPNGDQANDTWIIDRPGGLEGLDDAVISVYNKQGVLVFRAQGFDKPWDGTMNGERLPADTYFFTIDLQLRNNKTYKGIVTILR
ncbi:MAG: tandem-95 repeat protein [Cyclobacteriaceae bacterium]